MQKLINRKENDNCFNRPVENFHYNGKDRKLSNNLLVFEQFARGVNRF